MSELVAYRNKNTDEVHVFDGTNPDLEARPNFERVEDMTKIPAAALRQAQRARVERDMIESSAGINAQRVEVSGAAAADAARSSATGGEPAREGVLVGAHAVLESRLNVKE